MYTTESHPNHALPQPTRPPSQHSYQAGKDAVKAVDIPCGRVFRDGVVRYVVEVRGSESTWLIAKRYSQFETLHLDLIQLFLDSGQTSTHMPQFCQPGPLPAVSVVVSSRVRSLSLSMSACCLPAVSLPDLPPKKLKLFQSHNSPAFIEKRAVLLTNYLRKLLDNKRLVNSKLVHDFFTSDLFNDPTLAPTAAAPASTSTNPTVPSAAASSTAPAATVAPLPTSFSFTSHSIGSAASTAPSSPVDSSPLLSSSPATPTSSTNFRLPADSEITTLSIPTHRLVNGTVLYSIHCHSQHRPTALAHWTQLKRFSQLVAMDERLRASLYTQYDETERKRRLELIPERPAKRVSFEWSG